MAAFKTTPVANPRADQPSIAQRLLATSERFLLHPPAAAAVRASTKVQSPGVIQNEGRLCLPLQRSIWQDKNGRAAA